MSDSINIENHGLVGDGLADDSAVFSAAFDAMIASGTAYAQAPGAPADQDRSADVQEVLRQGGYRERGRDGASDNADPRGLAFSGMKGVSGRSLFADVGFQSWTIPVDDTTGIEPGHLLCLSTETQVLAKRNWPYRKQAHILIADIDHAGRIIHLIEPTNFHFTIQETSIETLIPSKLGFSGISLDAADKTGLRLVGIEWLIDDATIRGRSAHANTQVLRLHRCVKGRGNNLTLLDSGYTINVSSGSRHQRFSQIAARGVRHPIDANTFAFDTLVEDMDSYDTRGAIQCHPSFHTRFVRCRDFSIDSGVGLRGLGCSTEDCTASNRTHTVKNNVQYPPLKSEYAYLGDFYDMRHVRLRSDTAGLSAAFCRRFIVEGCHVPEIRIDGFASVDGVPLKVVKSVEIDEGTRADLHIRRVPVAASGRLMQVEPTEESGFKVINSRKIPGLGFSPRLHYRTVLRSGERDAIGAALPPISLKLKHNWGIWERTRRRLFILVDASSSTLGHATKRYELIVDQETGSVQLHIVEDAMLLAGMLRLSIEGLVPHYRPQIEAEGGDLEDADQWWLALDIAARTLSPSDPIEHIEAEIAETRLA